VSPNCPSRRKEPGTVKAAVGAQQDLGVLGTETLQTGKDPFQEILGLPPRVVGTWPQLKANVISRRGIVGWVKRDNEEL